MNTFTGTWALTRLILRRDRAGLIVFVLLMVGLVGIVAVSFPATYPTIESQQAFAAVADRDPAQLFLIGHVFSDTIAGLIGWRVRGQFFIIIGLVNLFLIIRHTRSEEVSGRQELLQSTVVGRNAPLAAALTAVTGVNLVMGILTALLLIGMGFPVAGSVAMGVSAAAAGWIMAAVGGVTAQLSESVGTARGIGLAAFLLFYMMRGVGDVAGIPWLSDLSPFGWVANLRPFAGEQWGPLLLIIGFVVVLGLIAFALSSRRDIDAGLLPTRPGPAHAASWFDSPLALAWRLQQGSLLTWSIGTGIVGIVLGSVAQNAVQQLNASQQLSGLLGSEQSDAGFFGLVIYIIGQLVAVYTFQSVLTLRSEEEDMRADTILTMPVSRLRWVASHLIVAAVGATVILGILGLAMGVSYGAVNGDMGGAVARFLAATLIRVVPAWFIGGLAAALYGFVPRFAAWITWFVVGFFLLLELLAEFKQIPMSALDISPFAVVPLLPAEAFELTPVVAVTAIAIVFAGIGIVGLQRRDIG